MARRVRKQCPACQQLFLGRRDAIACSERCRKRLQRARRAIAAETKAVETKITEAVKEAEAAIIPQVTDEAGFIEVAQPPATVPAAPSPQPPRPVSADVLPTSADIAPAVLQSPVLADTHNAPVFESWLDSHSVDPAEDSQSYQPPGQSSLDNFNVSLPRFLRMALVLMILIPGLALGAYGGYNALVKHPVDTNNQSNLDNQAAAGLFNTGSGTLHINYDTQLSNGKVLTATGPVVIQNDQDSTGVFKIQSASGNNILVANAVNKEIIIGNKPPGQVSLNVNGDITTNGSLVSTNRAYSLGAAGLTIGGKLVCTANGCVSSSSPPPTPTSPSIDVANLAYLNVNQSFSGINTFTGNTGFKGNNSFSGRNSFNNTSTTAFQVQNSTGTDKLFMVDTVNNRIGIGTTPQAGGATVQIAGDLNVSSGVYRIGNVGGSSLACSAGEVLQNATITGGIITGGMCVTIAGGTTPSLQQVYSASTPADIRLSSVNGMIQIQDSASPLATDLFEVTDSAGTTKYFAVNNLGISVTGNINTTGQYQINGTQISSANLSDSSNLAKLNGNQTFTGANTFSNASNSFTGSGAGLTSLNATNISSGTLSNARLNASVTLQGNTFNGANQLVQLTAGGILPVLSGANLTNLNASSIASGTLSDARLSGNVALLNVNQTFTGNDKFTLSSAALSVQDASTPLGADLFTVTNNSGATKYFEVSATGVKINGSDVCTSAGNCVGTGGGGAIGGSGTAGKLSKFTGSGYTIGDSIITDNGTSASVAGNVNTTGQYQVNGSQIASSNLSDGANLGKLNANQTFTGANTFSNGSNSFTGSGSGLTSLNATNVSSGTLSDSRLSANVALLNANQAFTGNDSFHLSTVGLSVQDASTPLGADLFSVTDNSGTTKYFEVSATGAKVNGSDVCTSAGNCVGTGSGGAIGGSGTANNIALFTGSGFTIGNSNLVQSAGKITNTGNFDVTGQYQVNGTQISSANLSNDSNLAKLNGNQTFTGANTFNNASNSFTGAGAGLTNLNATNVSSGTLSDARLSANVALKNANNIFTGNNTFTLNMAGLSVQDASSPLGTTLFQVTDNSGATKYFTVSATALQFLGNDVCTAAGNCAGAGNGGGITGSGTQNFLTKFDSSGNLIDSIISDDGSTATVAGALSVNTITPTATLTIGTSTQTLTLQGNASTSLSATSGAFTNKLVFAAPALSSKTITIPNASGTVAVSASGPLSLDAAGNLTCPNCLTTNGTGGGNGVTDINGLTSSVTLAGTPNQVIITPAGNTLTFSTPQDIGTASNVSFGNVNITGQYKVGGSQIASSNLADSANLAKLNAANTFTNTNLFKATSATALEVQNAAGSSTILAVDTSSGRIAINQASANYPLDVNGDINTTGVYRINGSQISSSNLFDSANLAKLNANQTFTGNNTFSSASNSFTGDGSGLTNLNASNISSGTLNDARLSSNVPLKNASNTFTNTNDIQVTNTNAFQVQSTSGAETLLNIDSSARSAGGGNIVKIGNSTGTDADTTILVVDSTTAAPTTDLNALNGGIFYNSTTGHISVIENGVVKELCNQVDLSCGGNSTTLQQAYDNSPTPATITTSSSAKNIIVQSGSGDNSSSVFQIQDDSGTSNLFIADTVHNRIAIGQATATYTLDVAGDINTTTGYRVGGTPGTTVTCSSGNVVQNATIAGGIITGGTCVGNGAGVTPTLAQVYSNGTNSAASVLGLNSTASGVLIRDNATPIGGTLFGVQNSTGSNKYLDVTSSGISVGGNVNSTGIYEVNGSQISTANLQNGSDIALLDGNQTFTGNNTLTGTTLIKNTGATAFQIQNAGGSGNLLIADTQHTRIAIAQASATYTLDVGGDINTTTGYRVGGTAGSGLTCSSGNVVQNAVVTGGIITGGTCVANGAGATTTLQNAYDNSSSPATITTSSAAKNVIIKSGSGFNSTGVFQVQDSSGNSVLDADSVDRFIGINNANPNATLDVLASSSSFMDGFETGLLSPFTENSCWAVGTGNAHAGSYSAGFTCSGPSNNTLSLTKTLGSAGTISFWANLHNTFSSTFTFNVDGATDLSLGNGANNGGYTFYSYAVASGTHTFTWNVGGGGNGNPFYYVDDVTVTNAGAGTAALFNGGNVGIGTSFPNQTLDVLGTSHFQGSSDSTSLFQVQSAAGTSLLNVDSTNMRLTTNQSQLLVTYNGIPAGVGAAAGSNQAGSLSGSASSTYYYEVTAIGPNGESLPSSEVSINGASFTPLTAPTASTAATGAAGNVTGTYTYRVTFLTANGETTQGTASGSVSPSAQQVNLTTIPLGPTGTTGRNVYRCDGSGNNCLRMSAGTTIANNTATTLTDNTASYVGNPAPPGSNTATTNTNNATISWAAVTGATSYRIYRGDNAAGEYAYQTSASSPFTDTGAAGTTSTTPTYSQWGSLGIGTSSPTANLQVAGTALFKNAVNNTNALQVQNAAGSNALNVSTNNNFFDSFETNTLSPFVNGSNFAVGTGNSHSGSYSVNYSGTGGGSFTLTRTLNSAGTISFWTKAGISGAPVYTFSIDGSNNTVVNTNTTIPYTLFSYAVATGTHTFTWTVTGGGGTSSANVDDVTVTNAAPTLLVGNGSVGFGTTDPGSIYYDIVAPTATASAFQLQSSLGNSSVVNIDTTSNSLTVNQGNLTVTNLASLSTPALALTTSGGSLANSTTYYYEVSATNVNGSTPAVASSPTSTTTSNATSYNTLSWTAVPNAGGYSIYRSINAGSTWFVNSVSSSTTSIIDNGTNYTWGTSTTPPTSNTTGGNLTVNGTSTFKNATNSTSAFSIQDASGASALNVDTADRYVGINNANPNATLDVLASSSNFYDGFETGLFSPFVNGSNFSVGTGNAHTGSFSVNYGSSSSGGNFSLTKTLSSAGTITFWAKAALSCSPSFVFSVDATNHTLAGACGNFSYTQFSFAVSGGAHTFTWAVGGGGGGSTASVDDVTITNVGAGTAALFNGGNVGIGTAFPNATLDITGTYHLQAASDNTAEFQIQSASAVDTLLTADTTNNKIVIGNATGTNTATTLLVLDSATADPTTGYNGAMYYNTTNSIYRCYVNGVWTNCGSNAVTLQNAYDNSSSPATITTSSATKGVILKAGNTYDSTNLFQVQNSSSVDVLNVDTTDRYIGVNTSTPNAALDVNGASAGFFDGFESGLLTPFTTTDTWTVSTPGQTGTYLAQSSSSSTSHLNLTETLSSPGNISFWWTCTAGDANDHYYFQIDSNTQVQLDSPTNCSNGGGAPSGTYSTAVTSGIHTFKWTTSNDGFSSTVAKLDNVTITNAGTATAATFNGGNVGIGTYYPNATLETDGTALFKSTTNSATAFQVQNAAGNNYLLVDTSGANLYLGNTGIASTIQIGNTTGAVTQTINIGNNSTASSTNNTNIGSSVAGSTAITGPTTVTNRTSGSADTFDVSNSTSTGSIAKFLDGNSANPVFSLADGGTATFRPQTDSTSAFQVQNSSGNPILNLDSSDRYVGVNNSAPNAALDVTAVAAPFFDGFESGALSPFTTGSTPWTAVGASGVSPHSGSFQAASGTSSMNLTETLSSGGTITYWMATNTGPGGLQCIFKIDGSTIDFIGSSSSGWTSYIQYSHAVGSGSHTFAWSEQGGASCRVDDVSITNISGSTAAGLFNGGNVGIGTSFPNYNLDVSGTTHFQASSDSATEFQVQNAAGNNYIQVDTSGANLYLGNTGIASTIQIGNTTGAVAQTIDIGNNATASSSTTVVIGSTIGSSPVTIQSGTGNITLNSPSIMVNGHLVTGNSSGSTTATVNGNAGTGATCSVSGNDTGGQITLVTGTAAWAAGAQCTINFANSFGLAPHPVITSANSTDTSVVKPYVGSAAGSFTVNFITQDTAAHTYVFNYFIAQ